MTNAEKFKEVFGFTLENVSDCSLVPTSVCDDQQNKNGYDGMCSNCPFHDWWNKEYKACFRIDSKYEQGVIMKSLKNQRRWSGM